MFDVNKLLDNAMKACGYTTDTQLAKRLNVRHSAVSNWRSGRAMPDVVSAAALADLSGEKLQRVIAAIEEGRAKSAKAKAIWRSIATAAAMVLAVYTSISPSAASSRPLHRERDESPAFALHNSDTICIAHV